MSTFKRGKLFLAASACVAISLLGVAPDMALAAQSAPGCTICHGMPPVDSTVRNPVTGGTIGNHQTHQPAEAAATNCGICHTDAAAFITGHRDGEIGLATNINSSASGAGRYIVNSQTVSFKNQTTLPRLGSCSSVNCHFEKVTPVWGGLTFKYTSETVNDCDECHGTPPAGSAPGNVGGAAGSHNRHNTYYTGPAQCKKCHPDHLAEANKFAHATSTGNRPLLVQLRTPKNVSEGSYTGALNDYLPSQSNAFGSCDNIYCHSDGKTFTSPYTRAAAAAPVWGGSVSCYSCHNGLPPYTSGKANSHSKHPFSCDKCHGAVTDNISAIINKSLHVNQQYDLQAGGGATFGVTVGNPTTPTQCSGISCHGGSSATWGATLSCFSCHGATFTTFSSLAKKGAHSMHIETETVPTSYSGSGVGNISTVASSYRFGCASCHSPAIAAHANNVSNVNGGSGEVYFGYTSATMKGTYVPGALQAGTDGALKWTAGTGCNTTYCHSNGRNGAGNVNVAWNAPRGALDCAGCHGTKQTGATATVLSGKHDAHMNPTTNAALGLGNGFNCADCHAKTVSGNTTISNKLRHVNKYIDYSGAKAGGTAKYNRTTKQCSNIYCHSNGNPSALVYRSMTGSKTWTGSATLGCNGCHGASNPNTGVPDYANGGIGAATANSHYRHVAGNGVTDTKGCAVCHVKTVSQATAGKFKDYTAASYHLNGTPNVTFKALDGKTGTWNGSTCANTYCHGANASAAWGTPTSLACNSCHSATATDTYWASNSAHKIHWQGSTLPTSYTAAPGNNVGDAFTYRFSCSSCHDKGSVHAGGPANANGAAEIFFGYTSATKKGSYTYGTKQGTTDNGFNWTNGGTGCSTTYCHSNGQGGDGQAVAWTTTASTGCVKCHDTKQTGATTTVLSGKHDAHMNPTTNAALGLGNGFNCADCHAKTVSGNTTISNKLKHVNKYVDYSGAKAGGTAKYNRTTKQCSNIYCHSSGNPGSVVYATVPAWSSTSTLNCNGCHGTGSSVGAPDYSNGGNGTATANSHYGHTRNAAGTTICTDCHVKTASAATTGRFKDYSAAKYHVNGKPDIAFGTRAGTTAAYNATTGLCSNVACHGNVDVTWGSTGGGCLTCHSGTIGTRAAIGPQFSANSHHVQGVTVTAAHCFKCHWEANDDGTINYSYHNSDTPGGPVDLVIYGTGRPATYTEGTTAIRYTANGTRAEFAKINTHCLGCHSDLNNTVTPFNDGKTPKQYAWDGNSIKARYGDIATTPWGKDSGNNVTPKNTVTKALSAHGNAAANHGGYNTSETWPDTRNGTAVVLCFDCHNSHGSSVGGTTTSYASATVNGGILKDTTAGQGGYSQSYKPAAGGSVANHNLFNAGAGLCFDCHLTASAGTKPWGYSGTFGATQAIIGFMDTPYFGPGTFPRQTMFSYKATPNMGGHFGASSALSISASHSINGLCTPCHDPHGVSPILGANKVYAVPLLKGTWVTTPYKEDVAPATDENFVAIAAVGYNGEYEGPSRSQTKLTTQQTYMKAYKIDQNTFSPGGNAVMNSTAYGPSQTDAQFAGLCLNCHAKTTLTNGTNHTWTSKDRIHESVKGWKTATGPIQHKFTCSKCHAPHNAGLPRLMVSNCLDSQHKGRVANNTAPKLSGSYRGDEGYGSGRWPGSYSALVGEDGDLSVNKTFTCHENNDTTQKWNVKTKWNSGTGTGDPGGETPVPVLIGEPDANCSYSNCNIQLQWNSFTSQGWGTSQYQVQVSRYNTFETVYASSSWQTGTSWTISLGDGTWYWRVMARNQSNTSQTSGWSAYDRFMLY